MLTSVSAECYGEEQVRVINTSIHTLRVPFTILQKALWENNEDETYTTTKMRHT